MSRYGTKNKQKKEPALLANNAGDIYLDCRYRIDLLIEKKLIVELKSVEQLQGIHQAQLITYMKLAGIDQGLLINFNVLHLKDGLRSLSL
jgi:GxxExxY protein